jgi:hypothetical protein
MTDDALDLFIDAYRAEHSARTLDVRSLRRRVLTSAGRTRLRSVDRIRVLLPLAATLAGSVALAASPPARERVREVIAFVRTAVMHPAEPGLNTPAKARSPGRGPRVEAPFAPPSIGVEAGGPVVAPPETPRILEEPPSPVGLSPGARLEEKRAAPAAVSFPVIDAPKPLPPNAAAAHSSATAAFPIDASERVPVVATAAPSASSRPPRIASDDLALYQRAHRLHFAGGDRSLALGAWDAYLKAFPRGAFAPEARLNRAVCLAQLGHRDEAAKVLTDIERGRFGQDGRVQAGKVLRAIDDE